MTLTSELRIVLHVQTCEINNLEGASDKYPQGFWVRGDMHICRQLEPQTTVSECLRLAENIGKENKDWEYSKVWLLILVTRENGKIINKELIYNYGFVTEKWTPELSSLVYRERLKNDWLAFRA